MSKDTLKESENFTTVDKMSKQGLLTIMQLLRRQITYFWEQAPLPPENTDPGEADQFSDRRALVRLFDRLYQAIDDAYNDDFKLKKDQSNLDWNEYANQIKVIREQIHKRLAASKGKQSADTDIKGLTASHGMLIVLEAAYRKTTPDIILIVRELVKILKEFINAIIDLEKPSVKKSPVITTPITTPTFPTKKSGPIMSALIHNTAELFSHHASSPDQQNKTNKTPSEPSEHP